MTFKSGIGRRRSLRLRGYDYSQAGAYFITICVQNRKCIFGEIMGGKMVLNPAGNMIQTVWDEIPFHYDGTKIDEFVLMPNHIHGIIIITRSVVVPTVGAGPRACPDNGQPRGIGQPRGVAPTEMTGTAGLPLPDIVHRFKTMTTKRYADGVKQSGWPSFPGKLWQRNYWEHIVRNETELNQIREYIDTNPAQWKFDRLNSREGETVGPTMVRDPVFAYPTARWMV